MSDFNMIIDGEPVTTSSSFDVFNPSTGAVVGRAPNASLADLDRAVEAARQAFDSWGQTPDTERQRICHAIADLIEQHSDELATLLTQEQGKPLNGFGSRFELGGAVLWARHTAGLTVGPKVLQDDETGRVEQSRRPLGVVGSITPWNFPIQIAVWHILPALRTGNTVVAKPSPETPLTFLRVVELMNSLLPPGVLNSVTSDDAGENIGAAMSAHPGIAKIVFTGSIATGAKVMRASADTIKRVTLELGGNDAGIVLSDVDLEAVAESLFWGAFINNGQTCAALKRLYVHDTVYDAVCAALVGIAEKVKVGDGLAEESNLGPMNNRAQFDRFATMVAAAKSEGRVLIGGEPSEGLFYPLTLIADLADNSPLVAQEQFGPALPILRYSDLNAAIKSANGTDFGLGGSVWSRDIEAAKSVAARMECGSVWINRHGAIQPNVPFGGHKHSGFGVEFAEEGLVEFTNLQAVFG